MGKYNAVYVNLQERGILLILQTGIRIIQPGQPVKSNRQLSSMELRLTLRFGDVPLRVALDELITQPLNKHKEGSEVGA